MLGRSNQICIRISIHAPIRERPLQVFLFFRLFHFNPYPHTGATPDHVLPLPGGSHFNPRPHTGATSLRPSVQRPGSISIHAPIRGRPEAGVRRVPIARHFNPRPLAGATHPDPGCGRARCNFNPRPLAGATRWGPLPSRPMPISIHAPLRGRLHCLACAIGHGQFQSTPPCGGDKTGRSSSLCPCDFNPRPLAGATYLACKVLGQDYISIHAPLRGRRNFSKYTFSNHNFNPRPLAGATSAVQVSSSSSVYFNPRPLAGATPA